VARGGGLFGGGGTVGARVQNVHVRIVVVIGPIVITALGQGDYARLGQDGQENSEDNNDQANSPDDRDVFLLFHGLSVSFLFLIVFESAEKYVQNDPPNAPDQEIVNNDDKDDEHDIVQQKVEDIGMIDTANVRFLIKQQIDEDQKREDDEDGFQRTVIPFAFKRGFFDHILLNIDSRLLRRLRPHRNDGPHPTLSLIKERGVRVSCLFQY